MKNASGRASAVRCMLVNLLRGLCALSFGSDFESQTLWHYTHCCSGSRCCLTAGRSWVRLQASLSGVCIFSLYLRGFCPGSPAFSHGQLETLNSKMETPSVCKWLLVTEWPPVRGATLPLPLNRWERLQQTPETLRS